MFQKETSLFRNRTGGGINGSLIRNNHQIISKTIAFLFCVNFFVLLPLGFNKAEAATYYVNSNCSSSCDGSTPSKGWPAFYYATNASNVPAGSVVEVVAGSGPYYERVTPDVNQDNVTWNFNGVEVRGDVDTNALVSSGVYRWVASGNAGYSGYYYLTETTPTLITNIVTNGTMEQQDGWANYATVSINERSSVQKHGGNFSRHVVANVGGMSQGLSNLTVGATYKVSGYYYLVSGEMRIVFFSTEPYLTTKGSWQYFEYNVTAASASTPLRIYNSNVTEFYVDDVKVEKLDGGGNPVAFYNPWANIFRNGSSMLSAVVDGTWNVDSTNTWTANKWGYGDFDSLGYNTLYVKWTGGNPTGSNIKILAGTDIDLFEIKVGATGHTVNDAHFIGSNGSLAGVSEAVTFNRCLFQYSRDQGVDVGTLTGGNLSGTTIKNSKFIYSGHRGVNVTSSVNPLNVYNNIFYGTHLMLRNEAVNSSVVNFKNNSNYMALAGSMQWANTTSTLNESNNQFHIDTNSQHGAKQIGFLASGTNNWTLSNSSDIPGSFNVTSVCDSSHPQNCGTDPQVDTNGSPSSTSPLIDSGTPISGLTTDYLNHHIYGTPDVGAYEYQPPYTIGTDNPNITSPIRIYADGKYRYTSTTSGSSVAKLSIAPSGGFGTGDYSQWMDVTVNTWHTSSDYYKSWTETSSNSALVTNHTIGDLKPNTYYTLKLETVNQTTYLSNGTGQITFTYSGGYSTNHTFELTEDTTPPTNIAISSITPDSSTQLTITAQTATDSESGLNSAPYWFHETSGNPGALSSSVWQTSTTFINTGLSPNTEYSYQVKAKDANNNESTYSTILSKYTLSTIPSSPLLSSPTLSSIKVTVNQNSNPSNTTYAIYESTTSRYVQADGTLNTTPIWQTYVSWGGNQGIQVISLSHNVQYTFEVKARNGDNTETSLSPSSSLYTTASISPSNFTTTSINTNSNTLTVDRFNNDTVSNAGYLFTNTTNSHTSNWIQTNTWQDTNLTPNTNYTYTVRYRNSQSVETTDATISFHTLAPTPTTLTITSLPLTTTLSTDIFPNSTDNQSGYLFTNTTNSHTSNWIQTNTWQDTNLNCYTTYTYTLKYRNADGTETSPITATKSTTGCGTPFTPPIKPDISNTKIIATNSGLITIDNLPATITQIAVSTTQDFKNSSWQDIKDLQTILNKYINTIKLYFKFKTKDGGVSDTIIYTPTNTPTIPLTEGDIVKTIDNPDVYIIKYKNSKQYKRLILSPNVFKSYQHLKWTNLKIISQEQLNQYTTSNLVQLSGDTNIYSLTPYGDEGERRIQNTIQLYDQDSVYEINKTDRDSYKLVK
jgi:hypothetical protein